jgi:hypothetical protein
MYRAPTSSGLQQTILNIHQAILAFAHDLMMTHPQHCHTPSPTIWMEGNFRLVRADFTFPDGMTERVPNEGKDWGMVLKRWMHGRD